MWITMLEIKVLLYFLIFVKIPLIVLFLKNNRIMQLNAIEYLGQNIVLDLYIITQKQTGTKSFISLELRAVLPQGFPVCLLCRAA